MTLFQIEAAVTKLERSKQAVKAQAAAFLREEAERVEVDSIRDIWRRDLISRCRRIERREAE